MFWSKKVKLNEEESLNNITVIPPEFYGAKDATIHYGSQNGKKMSVTKASYSSGVSSSSFFSFLKNNFFLYSVGILFLIGAIGGITWYYLNQAGYFNKPPIPPVDNTVSQEITATTTIIEEPVIPTPEVEIPIIPIETIVTNTVFNLEDLKIEFPNTILTDSADMDSDGLTDMEEEIYGVDSGIWDTDKDGYYDGQEVGNLYNPKGLAPVKIIDSGLVQEYVNSQYQYRLYYPISWQMSEVDSKTRQVLFNSITGDFIELSIYDLMSGEDFTAWFARKAVGQNFTDLSLKKNRFQEDYYKRYDGLVSFFVRNNNVYVFLYHTGVTGFIPFRHTMNMIVQSFRPSSTVIVVPDQVKLPDVPVGI